MCFIEIPQYQIKQGTNMQEYHAARKQYKHPPPAISVAVEQQRCAQCGALINGPTIGNNFCSFDCMQGNQNPASPPMPAWKPSV